MASGRWVRGVEVEGEGGALRVTHLGGVMSEQPWWFSAKQVLAHLKQGRTYYVHPQGLSGPAFFVRGHPDPATGPGLSTYDAEGRPTQHLLELARQPRDPELGKPKGRR